MTLAQPRLKDCTAFAICRYTFKVHSASGKHMVDDSVGVRAVWRSHFHQVTFCFTCLCDFGWRGGSRVIFKVYNSSSVSNAESAVFYVPGKKYVPKFSQVPFWCTPTCRRDHGIITWLGRIICWIFYGVEGNVSIFYIFYIVKCDQRRARSQTARR